MEHVPPPAGEPLADFPLPPAAQHADALKALARLRREAAAEIERLLTFLDETDGDPDLEDDDPAELSEVSGIADHDGLEEQLGGLTFPSGLRLRGAL